jgi:hypothetical protein
VLGTFAHSSHATIEDVLTSDKKARKSARQAIEKRHR